MIILFFYLLFFTHGFSPYLLPLLLTLSVLLSHFLSLSIFPVQGLCLLFILYHKTYIRIHSRVTRSCHHTWNKCTLAYRNIHPYMCANIPIRTHTHTHTYIYIYIYIHKHTHTSVKTHAYIYIHKIHVLIYCSHSHGLSSPL